MNGEARIVIPKALSERVKFAAKLRGVSARAFVRFTLAKAANQALKESKKP